MAKTSPTQRSLALLRKEGYTAQVVEKFIVWTKSRLDLFGCIDIVAIREDVPGVLGIQTTSGQNTTARITKSIALPALKVWLQAGNRFEVHGWKKKGKMGTLKTWEVDRRDIKKEQVL